MGSSQVISGLLQSWMPWCLFVVAVLTHTVEFDFVSVFFGSIVWWIERTACVLVFSLFLFFFLKSHCITLSQQGIQSQRICQLTTEGKDWINYFIFAFIVKTHPSVIVHLLTRLPSCLCMPAWVFWFWLNPPAHPEARSSSQSTWTHTVSRSVKRSVQEQNLRAWR